MNGGSKTHNWTNRITIFSVIVLVSIEIIGLFLALSWALWGLFELSSFMGYALIVCSVFISFWLCGLFIRQALSIDSSH